MNSIHHLKPLQCHHPAHITKPSMNPTPPWKPDQQISSNPLLPLPTTTTTTRSTRLRIHAGGTRGFGATKNDDDKNDDDDIPQVVYDRMLRRIAFFVGTPVVTGVGLLYLMSALKENKIWDVPLWLPFVSALFAFGTSALGIAYGTLSSSWEPEREGSMLGWEEAQKNWPELWKEDDKNRG